MKVNSEKKIDGWSNFLTGLGRIVKDKSINYSPLKFLELDKQILSNLYASDGLASKIVNCVAEDMLKAGWDYSLEENEKNKMESFINQIQFRQKLKEALILKRLYGGSVLVLGINDGQELDTPVNSKKIKNIDYITVFSCYDIDLNNSITDENDLQGRKLIYRIKTTQNKEVNIHRDRLLIFYGDFCPSYIGVSSVKNYWGLSVLEKIYIYISNLGASFQYLSNLLSEYSIKIFKFKDLAMILSQPEGYSLFLNRLQSMDASKGILNSLVLDKDEDLVLNNQNISGIPELLDRMMLFLSAVTNIPASRLFGRSPAGMNATGEFDLNNYYDLISSLLETDLKQNLDKFFSYVSNFLKISYPFEWWFNSLKQLDELQSWQLEKVKIDIKKTKVEIIDKLVSLGILTEDEAKQYWNEE